MLGVRYQLNPINRSDTAELRAALREREGIVPQEDIAGVEFTVQGPNGILIGNPATTKTGNKGTIHRGEPGSSENKGFEISGLSSTTGLAPGKTLLRGHNIKPGATVAT
jgi:hypothetical protein